MNWIVNQTKIGNQTKQLKLGSETKAHNKTNHQIRQELPLMDVDGYGLIPPDLPHDVPCHSTLHNKTKRSNSVTLLKYFFMHLTVTRQSYTSSTADWKFNITS